MTYTSRVKVKRLRNVESETTTQVLEDLPDVDSDLPDDLLASIPMPETTLSSNVNNICTNSVFNSCTIHFVVKK